MLFVFDLDGTLVDSRKDLADSANALLAAYGASPLPDDRIVGMVGDGAAKLVERACRAGGLPSAPADALPRFLALYRTRLLKHTRPYPGTREMLEHSRARGRLALLTNKPAALSRDILDGTGLTTYFEDLVGGDGPWSRKPDPGGLLWLAGRAGERPASTLLIGDSQVDRSTARAAGSRFCLAAYGFGRAGDSEPGELAIDRPRDLTAILDRLG